MKRPRVPVGAFRALVAVLLIAVFLLASSVGNSKERTKKPGKNEPITYSKHVARILQDKCQTCHHAGTAAPFIISNYDDAVSWGETFREVISDGRMPPWHADPRYGKFSNDRRLTKEEADTIHAWVETGMERGDPKELPPPPRTYTDGWMIGKPDVIFELPAEQTIPAAGVVPYQYFVTPTNFKEDVWIEAAEARPGNRGVVHHIIVFYRDPNRKKSNERGIEDGMIVGTAPGDMPLILPPGVARKIPAGAELVWQMHYSPNGKETKDRSQVGLVFYKGKEPPKRNAQTRGVTNATFAIPAGAANHLVESEWVVPRDTILLSFMPHMHLRGKDFEYRVVYPDGRTDILLSIPRYDFNWQTSYRLAEPLRLPKGTKIACTAHYDNSADNPANPDPKTEIRWGDQTWEEMMIGWIDFVWEQPEREALVEGFKAF
jgi:mono/diheme cytochrome c family protein